MKRLLLLAPLLLAAGPARDAAPYALATLVVRDGGTLDAANVYHGGAFGPVDHFAAPATHWRSDTLIAFEGPGWETDKVGYRLYLDARNVPDIYGKKLPGAVLPRIGRGVDDYHEMADWGRDIFQVDDSLGMGGIGVLRGGKATQLGRASIQATLVNEPDEAGVIVRNHGFEGAGGPADLSTVYLIKPGSRVTHVAAEVTGAAPQMVAGLRHHDGVTVIHSPATGTWRYVATYGRQSLASDDLGIALFYQAAQVSGEGDDGVTLYVSFRDPRQIGYAFAAAWEQEPAAPKDIAGFRAYLDEVDRDLEGGK